MNNKLLVVGTMAYDAISTPFGKVDKILGGAATYIGLCASRFSLDCGIVSVVGEDFENEHLELLKNHGIDLSGVEIVPGGSTFFWSGEYHNDLNTRTTLDTQLNVLENFSPNIPEHLKSPDIVMLGNLSPDVQLQALEQLKSKPKLIVLDTMNFWMEHFRPGLDQVIAKVDVISINDEEARQLTGEYSLVRAADKIHQMGPEFVIIKKGEHGALLFHNKEIFCAPALPLEEVFDPTGAGDSFAGGFTGYLTQTGDISFNNMKLAVIYGSAMASFTVEKFGTENLVNYTPSMMAARLKAFKELTTFEIEIK
ncbi:MAG: PfkB family carbohydrate kinase [Flavobacteriaceae bacterium]|mgnify:FL=1|jgi:sugar/nucleoside kinase (ribokinase family)|nr:sugar kinase [Flavobacteriaceae bacterium]MBT6127311.1 sugar kinase [Flavobacteriaceae bacterium]MDG1028997.1 PfkB family carbohydrate kinase [Flavobacteriaceae bacterium]MDG1942113.1 PfkB family carbohydrate kinase [Flavobacteriaceae bacterium]|tara:strand:+ start:137 stop:1066 length:930 start_codon:yes stop_codon:yes gene_type:complete